MKRYIKASTTKLVGSKEFNRAIERTAKALEDEDYDKYEHLLEYYDNFFGWEDTDQKMSSNQFEDCVTEYIEYGSHDIG